MIVLAGADLVLADRILSPGTLVIDGDRIVEISPARRISSIGPDRVELEGHYIVPAFIDVHVHGLEGRDTLDGPGAVAGIAARLPRYGVAAFCPTTVACGPAALGQVLAAVRDARVAPAESSARVLPAHLESNFINPEFRGAQPRRCLRLPPSASSDVRAGPADGSGAGGRDGHEGAGDGFTSAEILEAIVAGGPDVGIVTLAPELDGALNLIRDLAGRGIIVSLGHSGASFDIGLAAIHAGARQATHLFNRMPPLGHREPGLVGAVLQSEELAAELVCDGFHVHPAVVRTAIAAKRPARVMAITDATAGAGLPPGSRASLGGQRITVRESAAFLDDHTLAGSVLTMDRAFRVLVGKVALSPVDAALLCSTTPARELGLHGHGVIAAGAVADLAVLDRQFNVARTYIGGRLVFAAAGGG